MRRLIVIVFATLVVIAALVGSYASPLGAAANREISARFDVKEGQAQDPAIAPGAGALFSASESPDKLATENDPSTDRTRKSGKAFLGLVVADAENGARVTQVYIGGPAQRAGVKRGDIVREVNGARVANAGAVVAEVGKHRPGDTVTFRVSRGDTEMVIKVVAEGEPTPGSLPKLLRSPRVPELEELGSLPLAQIFGRFLSAELTFEGRDGQRYTLKGVAGTIKEMSATQIVFEPSDANAAREFQITEKTLVYSGFARSTADKLKVGDKVVVIVVGETNRAAIVAKTVGSWPLQRPIPNFPPPKNWGHTPDVQ